MNDKTFNPGEAFVSDRTREVIEKELRDCICEKINELKDKTGMSEKFEQFINELEQLCNKYDVTIASELYDQPAVWDGYNGDDIKCLLLDMTSDEVWDR